MTALVLDAGAFIGVDRGDRVVAAQLRVAQQAGLGLRTTGVVVSQVWRDAAGRQAGVARLLKAVDVRPVDERSGKQAGLLLRLAGASDAVDASVVVVSVSGDRILTSDSGDIAPLVAASGRSIRVVSC